MELFIKINLIKALHLYRKLLDILRSQNISIDAPLMTSTFFLIAVFYTALLYHPRIIDEQQFIKHFFKTF